MPIRGRCHCGATEFEVAEPPAELTRCTCSFCSKRGVLWAYYTPDAFHLISARDQGAYSARSPELQRHFHCQVCGCGTYSDTPVWENFQMVPGKRKFAVNARLFEDLEIEALPVTIIDGRNLW